jgi:hypothetical protein
MSTKPGFVAEIETVACWILAGVGASMFVHVFARHGNVSLKRKRERDWEMVREI